MKRIHVEFTAKNITGNAGLILFGQFAEKLGIKKILDRRITIKRGANADYTMGDIITMLMMGVLAGIKHMSHLLFLKNDKVINTLFNWKLFPDPSTFGKLFKRFNHKHCQELSEVETETRKKVWTRKWFPLITLDMDSTVIGVNGHQEGAEKGYNPKKKGQDSYHPLLCFIAENHECLHHWFRSGSAYTANGVVEFMKECFDRFPRQIGSVFVRADNGFFNGNLLDFLEEKKSQYLIKVKMKNLAGLLMSQNWQKDKRRPGIETADFLYQCHGWKIARRFAAIRILTDAGTDKGTFFPLPEYEFFCYVTNDPDSAPWNIHKLYGKRATSENWIQWCKGQMASGSIRTQDFWANSAIFQSCIFAYNLMVWMMWLTTEEGLNEEPQTIRNWLIHSAATLLHMARQWIFRLSRDYAFKERWLEIERGISSLSFA